MKKFLCVCMILVLALSVSACGKDKSVHYENEAWSITLPEGWMSMQGESLNEFFHSIDAAKRQSMGLNEAYIRLLCDLGAIAFYAPTLSANFYVASEPAEGITSETIANDLEILGDVYRQMGVSDVKMTGEVTFGKNKAWGLTCTYNTLNVELYCLLHDGEFYTFNFTAIDHKTVKSILSSLVFH